MSKATGARYERELTTLLSDLGYGVIRSPSSGSATARNLPDVIAGEPVESNGRTPALVYAIELKAGKATTLYVDGDEVDDLVSFCDAFGAQPFLCARWTTRDTETAYYMVKPDAARRTDGGAYGLPQSNIDDRASLVWYPGDGDDGE